MPIEASELSIIICTQNRPVHLELTLRALFMQRVLPKEIIISDAGTKPAKQLIENLSEISPVPIQYISEPSEVFAAAHTRNVGISIASGSWLLFLDGDLAALPGLIARHVAKAGDKRHILSGGFVRLSEEATSGVSSEAISGGKLLNFLPPRELQKLKTRHRKSRIYSLFRSATRPRLCSGHFSISAETIREINGFDGSFTGWGQEDDDLRNRLNRHGTRRFSLLASAIALHLWHPPAVGKKETAWKDNPNSELVKNNTRPTRCEHGITEIDAADLARRVRCFEAETPKAL